MLPDIFSIYVPIFPETLKKKKRGKKKKKERKGTERKKETKGTEETLDCMYTFPCVIETEVN